MRRWTAARSWSRRSAGGRRGRFRGRAGAAEGRREGERLLEVAAPRRSERSCASHWSCGVAAISDLADDRVVARRRRAAGRARGPERAAGAELHGAEPGPVDLADLVHLDEVRVAEQAADPALPREAVAAHEHLERDPPPKAAGPVQHGLVHPSLSALAEHAEELVAAESPHRGHPAPDGAATGPRARCHPRRRWRSCSRSWLLRSSRGPAARSRPTAARGRPRSRGARTRARRDPRRP
jgi:hypothetical protein